MKTISIVEYDPAWPVLFEDLRKLLSETLGDTALAIEHVGSTSVPGLCAKPVIDLDVVVDGAGGIIEAIRKLAALGYEHRGDLGVEGREAFNSPHESPRHHLYVCPLNSLGLRNHLAIRETLRANVGLAREYGNLKLELACRTPNDIAAYCKRKTDILLRILETHGSFSATEINAIKQANE